MNLASSANSPGSPDECLALKEAVRVRDDRICELERRCVNLEAERDFYAAKLRNEEQQVIRLRDQLTEMEREKLTARECVEAGQRLLTTWQSADGKRAEGTGIVGRVAGEGHRATNG